MILSRTSLQQKLSHHQNQFIQLNHLMRLTVQRYRCRQAFRKLSRKLSLLRKWNLHQKELELLQLKAPNFFQRILGRAEEKKEKLSKQIREITAAKTAAQWELEGLEKQAEGGAGAIAGLFSGLNVTGALNQMQKTVKRTSTTVRKETQKALLSFDRIERIVTALDWLGIGGGGRHDF